MTLAVGIAGIGLLGPGLPGWAASREALAGTVPFEAAPVAIPAPALLPATERRRTGPSVRLALAVATEAVQESGIPPEELDTVFASSNGEGQVITGILEALHAPDGAISPTQFHNSVHNAAAGYWGIAVGSSRPSVSLGGHDQVFATGLMQAAVQVAVGGAPVLFVAHDVPLPAPLDALRATTAPFALAFVLAPQRGAHGLLRLGHRAGGLEEPRLPPALDALRLANPVARALPLLAALARAEGAAFSFALLEDAHLALDFAP